MGSKPGNWEGLRKAARGLENEIDTKLVTFSKLGTSYSRGASGRWDEILSSHKKIRVVKVQCHVRDPDSDKAPLLGGGGEDTVETIQAEVESLLSQLGNINEEMAGLAAGAGAGGGGAAIHHTLQRHAEILQVSTVAFNQGMEVA